MAIKKPLKNFLSSQVLGVSLNHSIGVVIKRRLALDPDISRTISKLTEVLNHVARPPNNKILSQSRQPVEWSRVLIQISMQNDVF